MPATHKGSCQICGRLQKLPNGRLSLHGYAVRWNSFIGDCSGSHALPFNVSTDLIDRAIASATATVARLRDEIVQVQSERKCVWVKHSQNPNHYKHAKSVWVKLTPDVYAVGNFGESTSNCVLSYFDPMRQQQIEKRVMCGRDALVQTVNANYVRKLDGDIAMQLEFIAWQQARIADWQPTALVPV